MWNEIITLFSEMDTLSIIFLSVGLALGIIEAVVPGFGIFGIMSIIMTITGVIFRIVAGASITQVFTLVSLFIVFVLLLILVFTYSARFGLLSRSGLVENHSTISADYSNDKNNFAHLLGKEGVTQTICKPVGKVMIGDLVYQVFSNGPYLSKGSYVKVIEVDGSNIIVKKI